ncbi:MAG: ABC transporter ATP-binding protein [Dehalococcoidales bacterium]|nr:ABC transporter ATP-binding protein [Dehalococcoidales bacterium]
MNNDDNIIVVADLVKHFKSGPTVVPAVDGVSFQIPRGKTVALKGPSGCGKTTLLSLLGALDKPTSGSIIVDGVKISELRGGKEVQYRRQKIGFVFQSYYLVANLTAIENVMLPMDLMGTKKTEQQDKALQLLEKVKIGPKLHYRYPSRLSGGEQQRVAIARALANDPSVILADEPTGNLDSKTGNMIVNLLHSLSKEGRTLVIATHDAGIAAGADAVIEMQDGRISRTFVHFNK